MLHLKIFLQEIWEKAEKRRSDLNGQRRENPFFIRENVYCYR
jgi:hypothetical protein